jgi:hypothetical protein
MISTIVLLAAGSAYGCAPHELILETLERSGYAVVGAGPAASGRLLIEIYADEAGNWVAVLTRAADRLSCVQAIGTDWRSSAIGEAV